MDTLPPSGGASTRGAAGRPERSPRDGGGRSGRASRRGRRHEPEPEVYGITTARTGQHTDVNKRARRYMISMAVRLVCFVLAFVFYQSWVAVVFAAAAIFLPYVAVLMANAGRQSSGPAPTAVMSPEQGARPGPAPQPVRSIGAVPPRTTPAADPWADPRTAPRTGGTSAWQHSYAPPGAPARLGPAGGASARPARSARDAGRARGERARA